MNIFSSYRTGENRVTASTLAVLQSLSLNRIERLLGALLEDPEFKLVRFENQPSQGDEGVPDAIIVANICLLIETKTDRNAVINKQHKEQLQRHLDRLDSSAEKQRVLLLLTPDDKAPNVIVELKDRPIVCLVILCCIESSHRRNVD